MKKYISYCASVLALAALSACTDDFQPAAEGDGEGRLMLKATVNSDVKVVSRAGETNDELASKTTIWISNAGGAVYKYNSFNEVPAAGIKLLSGNYVAEAWAGDSVSASWDARYFKGREEFTIRKGNATQVELVCKIANTLVSVEFQDEVKALLDDISLEVGHDKKTGTRNGSLTFTTETPAGTKGYYMANSRSRELVCTLTGKLASNGQSFTYEQRIPDIKPATEYHLIVKHHDQAEEEFGGAWITIEVDESEVECEDEISITAPPCVRGINFDIAQPVSGTVGDLPRRSLWIASATRLTSVELRGDALSHIAGLNGSDFEIFGMTDDVKTVINNAGINHEYFQHDDSDFTEMKINFETQFLNSLPEGSYSVTVIATDANGRTASAVLKIMPTNAKVMLPEIDQESVDITSRSALLTGTVLRDDAVNYGIQYRVKGTQQWTKVAADGASAISSRAAGDTFTVKLNDLEPATTYEATAYCDGFESVDIQEFTTDGEPQLPNAGFEEWSEYSDGAVMPSADPKNYFWDSGNHGSITMKKNVTTQATDIKHSGSSSVKLESQFVGFAGIGKFAAGNLFAGQYLQTNGTDGELGWGRPFKARPTALRCWVKYTPQPVDRVGSNNQSGLSKGDMDQGIIYIALMDDNTNLYNTDASKKPEAEGTYWPVIVRTKSVQLFDRTTENPHIIAYGEKVFTDSDSDMMEVVIPLDYRRTDIKPSYIILVASASKGGDYFTGGPSVMYIDDFELIYDAQ